MFVLFRYSSVKDRPDVLTASPHTRKSTYATDKSIADLQRRLNLLTIWSIEWKTLLWGRGDGGGSNSTSIHSELDRGRYLVEGYPVGSCMILKAAS